jgi:predicted metal-dependent phosphoesterase TrpH
LAIDLHLHSTASDGTVTPAGIVDLAAAARLSAISLTDHDNLDGIEEARRRAAEVGVGFIPGAELSVVWGEATAVHLLVYYLEPSPGPLQDRLAWLRRARATRNARIAERLGALGLEIELAETQAEAGGDVVGRPHFAAVMVRKGYVPDMGAAFDRYLAAGRPGYVERERLEAFEAIRLARASGAVPVVAHPHTIGVGRDEYAARLTALVDAGLGGIEAHYAEYEPEQRAHLASLCAQLGVVATGGSDFHGAYKPGIEVGTGRGDLVVPDDVLTALEAERREGQAPPGTLR